MNILTDKALCIRLIGNINELKHSFQCGATLPHLLWKRYGCIELLFEMLEDYTERLELSARVDTYPIDAAIKSIGEDAKLAPYVVIMEAIKTLDRLQRIASATEKLVASESN